MEELPPCIRSFIPQSDVDTAQKWWGWLAPLDREDVVAAFDERWEDCFFGPAPLGDTPPTAIGGRFLRTDDAWQSDDWATDWREYLMEHSDVELMSNMYKNRTLMLGGGVFHRVWVEWSRTRFRDRELPPSEQSARRTSRST